jgi:exopolyphosphatase/guanosine-5'-triphosphate,3'-diphosphate pyrophosphatase
MKVAVIDIGFNSLKMVKYKVEADGSAKSFGQLGAMVRLGEGLDLTGLLGIEQIERTLDAIRLCRQAATLESIKHVLLIGTSPVREAANREEFLRRVEMETGLRMRVLTGDEEALYGFLGAAKSVNAPTVLFFDLGGGSLQMIYAKEGEIRRILSLPLGALKLTSRYGGKEGSFSRKNRARMRRRIYQLLPTRHELSLDRSAVLVGTGGTVRAMARFHQEVTKYPFNKIHNYSMELDSIREVNREFLSLKTSELGRIDAIGEDRSRTVAAGTVVVRRLMEQLDFERLTVSTHGLRDGILIEFLTGGAHAPLSRRRVDEVEHLLTRPDALPQLPGGFEVVDRLVKAGIIDERQKMLLRMAAGRARSQECAEADADSLFWVMMNDDLPMSHEDQLFMAISAVRARRPRPANWLVERYGALLSRADFKSVKTMGACLRLMEVMERSAARFRVSYSGRLRIEVVAGDIPFPLELAKASALALSSSIKRPVSVAIAGEGEKQNAEPAKVRS